jgi:hypothetical protein
MSFDNIFYSILQVVIIASSKLVLLYIGAYKLTC